MTTWGKALCSLAVSVLFAAPPALAHAQAFFRDQGADVLVSSPDAFATVLADDVRKWAVVVKASGARED